MGFLELELPPCEGCPVSFNCSELRHGHDTNSARTPTKQTHTQENTIFLLFLLRFSSTERQLVCRLLVRSSSLHHPVKHNAITVNYTQQPARTSSACHTETPIEVGSRGSTARTNNRKNHRHRERRTPKHTVAFTTPSPLSGEDCGETHYKPHNAES